MPISQKNRMDDFEIRNRMDDFALETSLPGSATAVIEDPQYVDIGQVYEEGKEIYDFSQENNVDPVIGESLYPLFKKDKDWKPLQPYEGWRNDVGRTIDETPRNLYIGILTGGAGLASAFKREGMRFASGFGVLPGDIVRPSFEPVPLREKPGKPPPGILDPRVLDTGMLPGTFANQAMGVAMRSPDAIARLLESKAAKEQAKLDKISLQKSPMARAMRGVSQNVPLYSVALGLGVLTGDSALSLGIIGFTEGGNAFQNQLNAGGSIAKSMLLYGTAR